MKLYVAPGACSLSCHIAFEEAGLPVQTIINDWDAVRQLNPQGAVPVLTFDDGEVLTQNIAILSHIASQAPDKALLPEPGTRLWLQAYRWLSWVASDLHPALGAMFKQQSAEERANSEAASHRMLAIANTHLKDKLFLVEQRFSLADAYLFVVYSWAAMLKLDTSGYPELAAHARRIAARPAVRAAMRREGLLA